MAYLAVVEVIDGFILLGEVNFGLFVRLFKRLLCLHANNSLPALNEGVVSLGILRLLFLLNVYQSSLLLRCFQDTLLHMR